MFMWSSHFQVIDVDKSIVSLYDSLGGFSELRSGLPQNAYQLFKPVICVLENRCLWLESKNDRFKKKFQF